jgi:peptidoglycan/xylan/chitin deacetylase (PgdA/CDA1 family)
MTPLRHRLFGAGFAAIAATRADRWLRPLARGLGVILAFHHVRPWRPRPFAPNALLEITPAFLDRVLARLQAEGFELVPLDAVPERLADPGPRPFAALAFDDGYRDNRKYALPLLRRRGAPWTMFVTADYAAGAGRLWWLELEEAVAALDQIELEGFPPLSSASPPEKAAAFQRLYRGLRSGPEDRLRAAIAGLCRQAGLSSEALVRRECLGFDELRAMADEPGLSFGAHTLSHPMLAKHPPAAARREIVEGRDRLERELGVPIRHFAYPVGDPGSAGSREFALAREAGFLTAVTTRPGHLFSGHREALHALPRVSINGLHQTDAALGALLSGVPFLAWNAGRRVDAA